MNDTPLQEAWIKHNQGTDQMLGMGAFTAGWQAQADRILAALPTLENYNGRVDVEDLEELLKGGQGD